MSRKLDKLSKKLSANAFGELWGSSKPKHMHWETYHRLMMAAINAEDHMDNAFLEKFWYWF
jgi:hypothetical protein